MFSLLTNYEKIVPQISEKLLASCNFLRKQTLVQLFSCEFCEIFKSNFYFGVTGSQHGFKSMKILKHIDRIHLLIQPFYNHISDFWQKVKNIFLSSTAVLKCERWWPMMQVMHWSYCKSLQASISNTISS